MTHLDSDNSKQEKQAKILTEKCVAARVPAHCIDSLVQYVLIGRPMGGFLTAVVCNDLRGACERADLINRYAMFEIVSWLYNHAPIDCWGSEEKFKRWTKRHGMENREVEDDG